MNIELGIKLCTGFARYLSIVLLMLSVTACASIISSAKRDFTEDLSATVLSHDDPETIKQAVPAYLVLVDSMIRGDQDNIDLLISSSKLYGAYASVFVDKTARKITLSKRAFSYANRAMCLKNAAVCNANTMSYPQYEQLLTQFKKEDAPALFAYGAAWTGLIQANSADWNAVAELPRAKATIQRVLELDEGISNGDAHVYMGVMESLLPPNMGGKPELAKQHFEKALKISDRKNLMALLLYAEKYARLQFDRKLHDSLLNELIEKDISQSDKTLIDTIAKAKARKLLDEANDYF